MVYDIPGPDFKDYKIEISGQIGITQATSEFNVRIRNPCIDISYFSISRSSSDPIYNWKYILANQAQEEKHEVALFAISA